MASIAFFAVLLPVLEVLLIISAIITLFYVSKALQVYIRKNRY